MFRKSLHGRRCAVPSTDSLNGRSKVKKIKYRFNLPDSRVLYMAGIYNEFKDENRFVILTTGANHSIADVHNRMPVILTERNVEGIGLLQKILHWPISKRLCLLFAGN